MAAMAAMAATKWREAAEKIAEADFLLVAAGAGFSADSSLPVYADIAKVPAYERMGVEYQDLCDPYMLVEDDAVFYGFWGNCQNSYRDAKHHRGYAILRKWRSALAAKHAATRDAFRSTFARLEHEGSLPASVDVDSVTNDPFFVYTSNVDGHFHREFNRSEVYELHGSVEQWQCAGDPESNAREPCDGTLWELDPSFRFRVDADTMRAEPDEVIKCRKCKGQGRPNVLMFHDKQWIANTRDEDGYVAWEAVVEQMLQENPALRLVVLEIGCGKRVPSVRKECEMVVADALERCGGNPQATLVRINPDFPECDHPAIAANGVLVSIASKGLEALEAIDHELRALNGSFHQ